MRTKMKITSVLAIFLAIAIAVPMTTSCSAIASYLLYQWIEDEFGNGDGDSTGEEPVITKVLMDREEVHAGDSVLLTAEATDNNDSKSDLTYYWVASAGTMVNPTSRVTIWNAPDEEGTVTISLAVKDSDNNQDTTTVDVTVLE